MPKNPTRKGFFFWWKGGSHYPIAKISTVEAGSVGEGETPCPVTLLSSLMGKNSPGLPLPRPPAKKKKCQGVYKRSAILCFLAGHNLPQAPDTGVGQAQKTWGGAAFSIFLKKKKKTDENELTAKK